FCNPHQIKSHSENCHKRRVLLALSFLLYYSYLYHSYFRAYFCPRNEQFSALDLIKNCPRKDCFLSSVQSNFCPCIHEVFLHIFDSLVLCLDVPVKSACCPPTR